MANEKLKPCPSEQARELLAAEYEAEGYHAVAREIREGTAPLAEVEPALRAIEKALASHPQDQTDFEQQAVEDLADALLDRVIEQLAGDADRAETLEFIEREIRALLAKLAPAEEGER